MKNSRNFRKMRLDVKNPRNFRKTRLHARGRKTPGILEICDLTRARTHAHAGAGMELRPQPSNGPASPRIPYTLTRESVTG